MGTSDISRGPDSPGGQNYSTVGMTREQSQNTDDVCGVCLVNNPPIASVDPTVIARTTLVTPGYLQSYELQAMEVRDILCMAPLPIPHTPTHNRVPAVL